jgi:hypothetical protein
VIGLISFSADVRFFGGWTVEPMDTGIKAAWLINATERWVGNSLIRRDD